MDKSSDIVNRSANAVSELNTSTVPAIMGRVSILPNRKPKKGTAFLRRSNGNETVTITPVTPDDWAYGMVPRKFLMACATLKKLQDSSVDSAQRRITFGASYRRLMKLLGMARGDRANKRRITEQIHRLMQMSLSYERTDDTLDRLRVQGLGFRIGEAYLFDFPKQDGQDETFEGMENFVQFSQQGWAMLDGYPVLTDDVRELGRSPLTFDIYVHFACRVYELKRATKPISWRSLYEQYGADYARLRDFKNTVVNESIPAIMQVWPDLNLDIDDRGIVIKPSPSPVVKAEALRSLMETADRPSETPRTPSEREISEVLEAVCPSDGDYLAARRRAVELLKTKTVQQAIEALRSASEEPRP